MEKESLRQIAETTNSYNVLTAIKQHIWGFESLLTARHLPDEYEADITVEELGPHFLRVAAATRQMVDAHTGKK